jgi:hypothetical protein
MQLSPREGSNIIYGEDIQHRISSGCAEGVHWMLGVQCWLLDVCEILLAELAG